MWRNSALVAIKQSGGNKLAIHKMDFLSNWDDHVRAL